MTTSNRSYRCRCGGIVAIPTGRRNITLEQVRANHGPTCPGGKAPE